jgi:RNA polymerase sigma factor (sigma-70 family)
MNPDPNDRSLMRRVRSGDSRAAVQLHEKYADRMRRLVRARLNRVVSSRVDAEDIVQSALGSFFRAAREGAYNVGQNDELWQLLAAIARHKLSRAHALHTAARRDARRTESQATAAEVSLPGEDETLIRELRLLIAEVTQTYPAVEHQIVEMRLAGYEVSEIAERTQRSKRTTERVLQRFRFDLDRAVRGESADATESAL